MGEKLLREHVQAIRYRLEALPQPSRIQRLVLEDNIVELKIVPDGCVSGMRLNFLMYEASEYPNSGGVMMTEVTADEALVETINECLPDPEKATVSDVLRTTCSVLGLTDPALLACLNDPLDAASAFVAAVGEDDETLPMRTSEAGDHEAGLTFEGEEDESDGANYSMYIGAVADREHRPGWKKLKWQETEEARVARRKEQQRRTDTEPGQKRRRAGGTGSELTLEEQKAADEQMWSSQEAFTILSNELYQLQTEAGGSGLEADAVDYNVHQWMVRLSGCSGPLGADLSKLKSRFGYDHIELRLSFKEDLHPFYPPTASVVRPRLHGEYDVLAALACHPRLQLRGWSPFQTTTDLLRSIRSFFEKIARVDHSNELNDLERYPGGAFSRLERQLARLGSLCEIVPLVLRVEHEHNPYKDDPWAQDAMLSQSSLGAILTRKKEREQSTSSSTNSKGQTFWAAGTGYGHDHAPCVANASGSTWDPEAMKAAQVAQDEELKDLVHSISDSLSSSQTEHGFSSREDRWQWLADLLLKSCLQPFLVRELSISYTNMGDRMLFFKEVFRLVKELLQALPEHAGSILAPVRPHLVGVQNSAQTFLQSLGSSVSRVDVVDDVSFARLARETAAEVERYCETRGIVEPSMLESTLGSGGGGSASSSAACPMDDGEEAEYCRCLRQLQFNYCDFGDKHTYAAAAAKETSTPQARTVRLAKELAGLASLLPLSGSSSVFVRIDNERQQLWQVLVTGPDDTPYSNGCFVFDCYFPQQYPMEPPQVKLLTTGNNTVAFNPNLYESGKVCLSLLGTWKGDRAENWDPSTSRMLQVLVSIQSLILVPEPYFNEPGYEREIGTSLGEQRSREYNMPVRENCIRWAMLDHLRHPSPQFLQVLQAHFRLRSRRVKETLAGWVADAEKHRSASIHKELLESLSRQVAQELERIKDQPLGMLSSPARAGSSASASIATEAEALSTLEHEGGAKEEVSGPPAAAG